MGLHAETLPPENLVMIAKVLMTYECVYSATIAVIKVAILLLYIHIFPTRGSRIAAYISGAIAVSWAISIVCVSVFQCTPVAKSWNPRIVFCSIYRFTTLFKFQPDDTTWTLGDACTWCVIECTSGIISGCMPILRPLFMMISSALGSRGDSGSRSDSCRNGPRNSQSRGVGPYGNKSRSTVGVPAFRPKGEILAKNDVRMDVSLPDEADGDEVPLNNYSIRVHRDVTWQESVEDGSARAWR
ncbi:hypothetical protein BDW69DRAFT_188745 [Aspergillus filifer]